MKTIRIECENFDSCTPGTSHLYPAVGEQVTLLFGQGLRVRGDERSVLVSDEWPFIVFEIDAEAHQIVAPITEDGEALLVYVPIHDLDWPDRTDLTEEEI